jgi:uncharacterized protein (TIGR03118 family)
MVQGRDGVRRVRLGLESLEDRSVPSGFQQTDLVSDQPGVALITDPKLNNAWGVSFGATGPFWVSDNGTGFATLYQGDSAAKPTFTKSGLEVNIPSADPAGSTPTGQVFNNSGSTTDFQVPGTGKAASFIFASQTGELTAWNGGTLATIVATVSGASFTGLAIGKVGTANYLYATDFGHHTVDVFDGQFHPVTLSGSFTDPTMPHSYAPFNVQNIGGKLYVTYAQIDQKSPSNESDKGAGFVDVFDTSGNLLQRLISGNHLNAPWGIALAPSNFGELSNDLLVGNFGNGHIQAFDPTTGQFLGLMNDASGKPVVIDGLWDLTFGNGGSGGDKNALYFTAGPDGETHGLFGSLRVAASSSTAVFAPAVGGIGTAGPVTGPTGQAPTNLSPSTPTGASPAAPDGATDGRLSFTVPVSAGFPAVASVFVAGPAGHPVWEGAFGSLYDPADGSMPLGNWA